MGADILNLVHKYGDNAKDLNTLYGFRLLLKKRAAEYKKVIGLEVDPEKLKELIWNAKDPNSKMPATQMGIHRQECGKIVEHVDDRYRVTFGDVEFQSPTDGPIGVCGPARSTACCTVTDQRRARVAAAEL